MPKRLATISAVEPMESFTIGSVRPFRIAITGARCAGRNFDRQPRLLAEALGRVPLREPVHHRRPVQQRRVAHGIGAAGEHEARAAGEDVRRSAESSACRPEAQLRITVHAGTLSPQPSRSETTRPMLASSADGMAAPTITSSNAVGFERLAQQQRPPRAHREVATR